MQTVPQIQSIALEQLHPHPKNANRMAAATMKKLARHIAATGRYEPLIVRPHPAIADHFELINGHHRKEILASLGHTHANCLVWQLTDAQTLLLLATINRLGGEDAPSKRLDLLDSLADALRMSHAEMAELLPEDAEALDSLLSKALAIEPAEPQPLEEMPEAFTIFLSSADKKELLAALARTDADPAAAIMQWARAAGNARG